MYLIDTNVISELRKNTRSDSGVIEFFSDANANASAIYLSAITIGELRRGVEMIRHRRDWLQAAQLETWLNDVCHEFRNAILALDEEVAQVWGKLQVPNRENAIDKQIAATALLHDLTVVTRNIKHFQATGVRCINPFRTNHSN